MGVSFHEHWQAAVAGIDKELERFNNRVGTADGDQAARHIGFHRALQIAFVRQRIRSSRLITPTRRLFQ
jgi:hypothetical protein